MTIYNDHPYMKLASPVCFCNRGKRYEYCAKRTNTNTVMKIDLKFDLDQDAFEGILMYNVRRKGNARSNHQYSKVIEEALKMMRFLVAWKIERSCEPKIGIVLAEYDNRFVLNEDKLAQLHGKVYDLSSCYSLSRWLMYDNTVLETMYMIVHREGFELKIDISQGDESENIIRSMWPDSARQVSFLMMIYSY
jgi:hypothetical protein